MIIVRIKVVTFELGGGSFKPSSGRLSPVPLATSSPKPSVSWALGVSPDVSRWLCSPRSGWGPAGALLLLAIHSFLRLWRAFVNSLLVFPFSSTMLQSAITVTQYGCASFTVPVLTLLGLVIDSTLSPTFISAVLPRCCWNYRWNYRRLPGQTNRGGHRGSGQKEGKVSKWKTPKFQMKGFKVSMKKIKA